MTFTDNTGKFDAWLAEAIDEGLGQASFQAATLAARSMPGAGAAAWQPTKRARLQYRASNIGQPPGVRRGGAGLKGSITNAKFRPMSWGFGTNLFYGRLHERGYSHPGGTSYIPKADGPAYISNKAAARLNANRKKPLPKTKPFTVGARPFLWPAYINNRLKIERTFTRTASRSMARRAT